MPYYSDEERRRKRRFPGNPTRSITQEQLEYAHDSESYRPPPPPATSNPYVAVPGDFLTPAPAPSRPQPAPIGVIPGTTGNSSAPTGGGSNHVSSVSQGPPSSSNQSLYTLGEQILRRNRQRSWQDEQAQQPQQSSEDVDLRPDYAEYESDETASVAPVNIPATAAQRQHLEVLIAVEDDDNVRGF